MSAILEPKRNLYIQFIFLFIVLFPFYAFASGTPQPADAIVVFLILAWLIRQKKFVLEEPYKKTVVWLFIFVFYTFLVNLTWGLFNSHFSLRQTLTYPIFYLYNAIVFNLYVLVYSKYGKKLLTATVWGIFFSVALQIFLSPFGGREVTRQILFFNNPNQLGYYAIICASFFMIGSSQLKINVWCRLFLYLATAYMAFISVSKAALVAILLIMCVSLIKDIKILLVSCILGCCLLLASPSSVSFMSDWSQPFIDNATRTNKTDSLEGRAYDRIWVYPEHLALGAGEGGFTRFHGYPREMHSSIGTLIFSYGTVGTFIFLRFLYLATKDNIAVNCLYLMPVVSYSLTHQALRFTLVWVLLAFIFCLAHHIKTAKKYSLSFVGDKPLNKESRIQAGIGR